MKKTTKKTTAPVTPAVVVAAPPVAAPTKTVVAAPVASPTPAAPVKAAPAPAPAKTQIVTAAAPITIEARIDVGFGNKLYVRGQGAGLSWEQGTPLECVDSKTWRLIVPANDKLQFKLLLNDAVWAKGEDLVAAPGKKVEVTPAF
jgi:hypothetical protein